MTYRLTNLPPQQQIVEWLLGTHREVTYRLTNLPPQQQIVEWLLAERVLVLWAIWVAAGTMWGIRAEGWDVLTSIYFAVSGLATGGLQARASMHARHTAGSIRVMLLLPP